MKLKLRRNQKSGMMGVGKVTFSLTAQTELSPEEADYVKRYKMGGEVVYYKEKVDTSGIPYMGDWRAIVTGLAARALNLKVTVDDLVNGRTIQCKDIVEMLAAEDQIKQACEVFKAMLESAAHFEGEEVLEF